MTKWKQRRDAKMKEQQRLRDEFALHLGRMLFDQMLNARGIQLASKEKVLEARKLAAEATWAFADEMMNARNA